MLLLSEKSIINFSCTCIHISCTKCLDNRLSYETTRFTKTLFQFPFNGMLVPHKVT